MKHLRLLILLPLVVLLSGSVTQQHLQVVARKNVAAGTCSTLDYEQTSNTTGVAFLSVPSTRYMASVINSAELTSGITVCSVSVELTPVGDPQQVLRAYIYSNDDNSTPADFTDDNPDAIITNGTSTTTYDLDNLTATAWVNVEFNDAVLSSGTTYWIVLASTTTTTDVANHPTWLRTTAGHADAEEIRIATLPPTWNDSSSSRGCAVRLYSE